MSAWLPMNTIPLDEEVKIRWEDGTEAIAILMSPAPVELDPDQQYWWGVDAFSYSDDRDWWHERVNHYPDNAIGWQRLPYGPQNHSDIDFPL